MAEEDIPAERPKQLAITGSLEPLKSKFFHGEQDAFEVELQDCQFHFHAASYKYVDDYDDKPNFIVNNFLKGLINQLEDKRKYLFAVFRCSKTGDNYQITTACICNTVADLAGVIPDKYDDFSWTSATADEVIQLFKQGDDVTCVYLH